MSSTQDIELNIAFEFLRATENAALNPIHWLDCGNKEAADEAACDATTAFSILWIFAGRW